MGKVGRGQVFIDGKFGAEAVRDWVWHFWEGIIFVGKDEIPDES